MKSFEAGSVLKPEDYRQVNHVKVLLYLGAWVILFTVVFVVPLLN